MKKFILVLLLLVVSAVSSFAVTIHCSMYTGCSTSYAKFKNVRGYKIDQNGVLTFITKDGQTIITSNYTIFLDK